MTYQPSRSPYLVDIKTAIERTNPNKQAWNTEIARVPVSSMEWLLHDLLDPQLVWRYSDDPNVALRRLLTPWLLLERHSFGQTIWTARIQAFTQETMHHSFAMTYALERMIRMKATRPEIVDAFVSTLPLHVWQLHPFSLPPLLPNQEWLRLQQMPLRDALPVNIEKVLALYCPMLHKKLALLLHEDEWHDTTIRSTALAIVDTERHPHSIALPEFEEIS